MKKKRKFRTGGEFELSPEALAAGLSIGRNENIRPADREAGIAAVERAVNAAKGMSDKEANLLMKGNLLPADMQTPAGQAEAIPVSRPRANAGRSLPATRAVPSRNDYSMNEQEGSGRGVSNPVNHNDYSMNEQEGSGRGYEPAPRPRAPSRGSYDRPGPVGGAVEAIKELMSKTPRARAAAKRKLLRERPLEATPMKKGGAVKAKRGDGIAQRGKTKGRFV
jgi:hypothetical protein